VAAIERDGWTAPEAAPSADTGAEPLPAIESL
jgi:hypothetical protein